MLKRFGNNKNYPYLCSVEKLKTMKNIGWLIALQDCIYELIKAIVHAVGSALDNL